MQTLENVTDQSSIVIKVDFTDEAGDPVSPESASWTLTDGNEEVINSRQDVSITALSETVYISLTANDLIAKQECDPAKNTRIFVVTSTYISSLTGDTLQARQGATFVIDNLPDPE
jgi:hypothetical protein